MGQQIIRQPDGRFCVWSTSADDIIVYDATADELVECYARMAGEKARHDTRRIIDAVAAGNARKIYYQFTMTFDDAVAMMSSPSPF